MEAMQPENLQILSDFANSATSLTIALAFCFYLIRQVQRRDDLFFEDWKRQRDKELSKDT